MRLLNVTMVIAKVGNTSRPQRDYRPLNDRLLPGMNGGTIPALVDGSVMENVEDIDVLGGSVAFVHVKSTPSPTCWGMECLNASSSHVHIDRRWRCYNSTLSGV